MRLGVCAIAIAQNFLQLLVKCEFAKDSILSRLGDTSYLYIGMIEYNYDHKIADDDQNYRASGVTQMNSLTEDLAFTLLKSQEEFPIDFDDAWQWLDYSRKNNAKVAFLGAGFVEGIDFQVLLIHKQNSKGGRPYEQIKLTIDCFKSWAMMANTPKGRLARRYFLECEKRLKEILSQQSRTNFGPEKKFHPYIERVEEALKGKIQVPFGYWCVLLEAAYLLIYVDKILGFPVDRADLLDGSIGLAWSKYREDKEWVGDRLRCKYQFPDGRWCNPWCYELHELPVFRLWLDKEYKHRGLPSYLNSKYGSIIKI